MSTEPKTTAADLLAKALSDVPPDDPSAQTLISCMACYGLRIVWDDEPLSPRDAAMIDDAWERHKASGPVEMAERFIREEMRWHPDTSDEVRSIVIANVRGFAGWIVEQRHGKQ